VVGAVARREAVIAGTPVESASGAEELAVTKPAAVTEAPPWDEPPFVWGSYTPNRVSRSMDRQASSSDRPRTISAMSRVSGLWCRPRFPGTMPQDLADMPTIIGGHPIQPLTDALG
jgi:hypothetical protein